MSDKTLRDEFAMAALTGILAKDLKKNDCGNNHINHALVRNADDVTGNVYLAFEYADAMLKEREKTNHE